MTDSSLALVRRFLLDRYDDIKRRLTMRLGSADLAGDALQDAWIKIARVDALGAIRNPGNFIFGVALNAARDRMRDVNNRHLSAVEIDSLLEIPDDAPGPERVAEGHSDWRMLAAILDELPPLQRDILLAARLDGMPRREIARRLGISLRVVERELQLTQEHLLARRKRFTK